MAYLILPDYYSTIQDANLQQILSDNDDFRLVKQATALSEIKSYLAQKYDIAAEFQDVVPFSFSETYNAGQLVYLDATAYSATTVYTVNQMVLQAGNVYYSKAGSAAHAFTSSEWTLIGARYKLFYVNLPVSKFDYEKVYSVDDVVFYKNKTYTALKSSTILGQSEKLQYGEYDQLPFINQFPDSTNQNQWSQGTSYTVTGKWPTDDKFTAGDNRNAQLVEMNVIISIYKLSPRISPKNIPDIWVKNYDDAISWLKKCAKGEVTLDMPKLQPKRGGRIRWGSSIKRINDY